MTDAPRLRRRRARDSDRAPARRTTPAPESASSPAVRSSHGSLLTQLLDNPHLPQVVPRLQPEVLHRVIDRCGLEDCGAIIALATPSQLSAVFDIDLWRSAVAGLDEQFDAERFGTWLEVMVSHDVEFAARTLAALDPALVSSAFAAHISVFDPASLEPSFASDDEREHHPIVRAVDADVIAEIGGYRIVPKRQEVWDAVVDVLIALDANRPHAFHALLGRCRRLSNDGWERDGLDDLLLDSAQHAYDVASDRRHRREQHGYVSAAEARGFLQMARELRLDSATPPAGDGTFRAFAVSGDDEHANAVSAGRDGSADEDSAEGDAPEHVTNVLDLLREDGVLPQPPRALLQAPEGHVEQLSRIHRYLRAAQAHGEEVYARRVHELMLLANTLVAGCSFHSSRFSVQDATDAAVAVCNLGLEHWPRRWRPIEDEGFPVAQDLIGVFQVGWNVLYREACLPASEALVAALDTLASGDTGLQEALMSTRELLRKHLRSGDPWLAADSLDVVMSLDMCAWAVLVGLIAEYPVIHEAVSVLHGRAPRRIDAAACRFIAEDEHLDIVREFLAALAPMLRAA